MLAGRTGLSPVMVGRAGELRQLVSILHIAGSSGVALVGGEGGIGKTRLIQELVAQAPAGTVVLAGQADPGVSRPLALVTDLLDGAPMAPVAAGVTGGPVASVGRGASGRSVASGASGDATAAPDPRPEAAADRAALAAVVADADRSADERVDAAVTLVRRLTDGHLALVVFEDIHWADPESMQVFERLALAAGGSLVVVATYRPDGLSRRHPASSLLPRLERRQRVVRVHLGRLTPVEVRAFLYQVYREVPSVRVIDALYSRTAGNPLLLEELIAAAGTTSCDNLDRVPLPWTVAEATQGYLDGLDPDVRRVVAAAAVLGRRVPFDVLMAVTQATEDELIERLHAAVDDGVLVEIEPDYFGFRHELKREAIEASLLGREKRRLHETALAVLRDAGSRNHAALAHHARGAGRHRDMVEHARRGTRDALAHGATYQALQLAEMGLGEVEDDVELLSLATRGAWLAGLLDDAAAYADRWLRLARSTGDVVQEAEALLLRIRAAFEAGDRDSMASLTDALIATIDRLPTDDARARAMVAAAQSYMLRGRVEPTCAWADKALDLAESLDLVEVRVAAKVEKGSVLLSVPPASGEGRALLHAALDEAEEHGMHMVAWRALHNLTWHTVMWDTVDDVRRMTERMREHADAAGWLGGPACSPPLAYLAAVRGELDDAIAQLDADIRGAEVRGAANPPPAGDDGDAIEGLLASMANIRTSTLLRARLALEAAELDDAARLLGDVRQTVFANMLAEAIAVELQLACRRRATERARALLADLLPTVETQGHAYPPDVNDVVTAALAAGTLSPDELRPLVERAGYYAGHRLSPDDPWRQLLDAQLAEAAGDLARAAELYAGAAETLGTAPDVLAGHHGTAHVRAARCLVALGRLDEARDHAKAAAERLARWRGWRVEELDAVQRRLGLAPAPSGPAALTPREREVAELLGEGLTNAQLAGRLYISPRTAAVHVSNLLAKLGMSSRTEVAAWVAAGGLAEPAPTA